MNKPQVKIPPTVGFTFHINKRCQTDKIQLSSNKTEMSSIETQIIHILEAKLLFLRPSDQFDFYNQFGRDVLLKQIQRFIEYTEPIQLLLLGFPCKSPNLKNISVKLPDADMIYTL